MDVNEKVAALQDLGAAEEQIEAVRGYPTLGPLLAVVEALHGVVVKLVEAMPAPVVEAVGEEVQQ